MTEKPSAEEIAQLAEAGGLELRPNFTVTVDETGEVAREEVPGKFEESYSAREREQIADAVGDDVGQFVRAGIKLKDSHDPRPKRVELSDEQVTTQAALETTRVYRERAQQAEAGLSDHQLALDAVAYVEQINEAWESGELDEDAAASAHANALQLAFGIEEEALREDVFAKLEEHVDPDLFEGFVSRWQNEFAQQAHMDTEQQAQQAEQELEQHWRRVDAVLETEAAVYSHLSEDAQAFANQLLRARADEIARLPPEEAQLQIRYAAECGRVMAAQVNASETQAAIVRGWDGPMRGGWEGVSGRDRKQMSSTELGLDNTEWSDEIGLAAMARAKAGVEHDRQRARRIYQGSGPTASERTRWARNALADALGIPVQPR